MLKRKDSKRWLSAGNGFHTKKIILAKFNVGFNKKKVKNAICLYERKNEESSSFYNIVHSILV
ncbi:hypothetical protein HN51_040065 [Arachis hypogaea]